MVQKCEALKHTPSPNHQSSIINHQSSIINHEAHGATHLLTFGHCHLCHNNNNTAMCVLHHPLPSNWPHTLAHLHHQHKSAIIESHAPSTSLVLVAAIHTNLVVVDVAPCCVQHAVVAPPPNQKQHHNTNHNKVPLPSCGVL